MKKWTVAVLALAMTFFGLSGLALAGGLESASDQKDMTDLKDQVASLVDAVNELKQENNLLKAKDAARDKEIASLRTAPSVPQASVVAPSAGLETQLGQIKIAGGAIGTVFATVGHEGGGAGSGTGTNNNNAEDTTVGGDQIYGAGAFWLDIEAPVAKNTKIFAELEVNSNSSGVLEQQPYPSLHLPNGIATFSTNLNDGATAAGFTNTRGNNIDVVNLLEVYVESKWFDNRLTTQVGKLDLTNTFDHSRYASSDRNQFVAKGLAVNPALLSSMPLNTYGARAAWSENKKLLWDFFDGYQFQVAAVKGVDSGRNLFNQLFGIGEFTLTTNAVFNRPLDIRTYVYSDGANHSLNANTSSKNQWGFGFGVDYQLIPNKLGIFTRYGLNTNEVASLNVPTVLGTEAMGIKWAMQAGAEWTGFFKNRPEDVWGIALSTANIYETEGQNFQSANSTTVTGKPESNETFFETYYNYKLNNSIHISPFVQFVLNGAGDHQDNAAAGIRSQITF